MYLRSNHEESHHYESNNDQSKSWTSVQIRPCLDVVVFTSMCWCGLEWNLVQVPLQSTSTHVDWCEYDYIQTRPKEEHLTVMKNTSNEHSSLTHYFHLVTQILAYPISIKENACTGLEVLDGLSCSEQASLSDYHNRCFKPSTFGKQSKALFRSFFILLL